MEEKSTILNRLNNIVGDRSELGGECAVALSSSIEISIKSSRSASNSLLEVEWSSEVSTNVDSFLNSGKIVVASIGVNTTRGKDEVSRNNKGEWQITIGSVEGLQFTANRETRDISVVSNSNTSLNITAKIDQITERNQIEVSERRDGGSNGEGKSVAIGLKVWAENSGRRRSWWRRGSRAVKSVDLVGNRNGSNNNVSNNCSSRLVQGRARSQDTSFGLIEGSDNSSSSGEVVKEVFGGNKSLLALSERDRSTSDREDEETIEVAVYRVSIIVDRVERSIIEENVISTTLVVASNGQTTRVGNGPLCVGGSGSKLSGEQSIVSQGIGKIAREQSGSRSAGSSCLEISWSSEGSSNKGKFSWGEVSLVAAIREDGSSVEFGIVSNNEGEGKNKVSCRGTARIDFNTNRISASRNKVVLNGKTSLNISSRVDNSVVGKGNGIKVAEANRSKGSEGRVRRNSSNDSGTIVGESDTTEIDSSSNSGWGNWSGNKNDGSINLHVRSNSVSFGIEDGQSGSRSIDKASSLSNIGQSNRSAFRAVNSSEIQNEEAIGKDVKIIISAEIENLSLKVSE